MQALQTGVLGLECRPQSVLRDQELHERVHPPRQGLDAFGLSPAPKRLLVVPGGEHTLGGIAGEAVSETTDTDPDRVALVADAVTAYLLDALELDPDAWSRFRADTEAGEKASFRHKD
ncbi:hypothetical protein ACFRAR_04315 [Kitasatospora sp. NPDC056651]|uniref:hypothetical protein n=1 Tax=Kitasatospora sp. NPDC056651 TaxID=3345892 RepID=UPI0036C20A28